MRGKNVRCFIAIDIEKEDLVNEIIKIQKFLQGTSASLKLVESENLHLTLKFLGETPQAMIPEIEKALDSITFKPFQTTLQEVGVFPNINYIRVVWIGVSQGLKEFSRIHEDVDRRMSKLSFRRDRGRYSPHLTIARVRTRENKEQLVKEIQGLEKAPIGSFLVDTIRLKQSTLTPKGPIYTTLYQRKVP